MITGSIVLIFVICCAGGGRDRAVSSERYTRRWIAQGRNNHFFLPQGRLFFFEIFNDEVSERPTGTVLERNSTIRRKCFVVRSKR